MKDVGYLWVPLAVPWWPKPLLLRRAGEGNGGGFFRLTCPGITDPPGRNYRNLLPNRPSAPRGVPSGHHGLSTNEVSAPSLVPNLLFLADLLTALDRGGCVFFFISFLRLRWQDKVLGGEPNSRFQGRHFSTRT